MTDPSVIGIAWDAPTQISRGGFGRLADPCGQCLMVCLRDLPKINPEHDYRLRMGDPLKVVGSFAGADIHETFIVAESMVDGHVLLLEVD